MAENPKHRVANTIFNVFTGIYAAAAFAYGMYGVITQTGLSGQLIALQLRWFGVAYLMVTAIAAICVLMLPLIPLWAAFRAYVPETYGDLTKPGPTIVLNGRVVDDPAPHLSWKMILIFCVVILVPTLAAAGYYYAVDKADESATVHRINLDETAIPADAKFLELTGHWARKNISSYREGTTVHVFVPVVSREWTAGEPVRVLIHATTTASEGTRASLPSEFNVPRPVDFPGRASGAMPVTVLQDLTSRGMKFDANVMVLDRTQLVEHRVPPSVTYLVILGGGGLLTVMVILMMVLARWMVISNAKRGR